MTTLNPATTPAPMRPSPRYRRQNPFLGYLLVAPPMILVIGLIFFPVLQSVIRTLTVDPNQPISFSRYVEFFANSISVSNFWFTVWISLITLLVLCIVCFPLALYLRFSSGWLANAVQTLALFPIFVPGIILAFSMIRFIGPRGTVQTLLSIIGITQYSSPYLKPLGIIIGLVWDSIPFTLLLLTAGLRQVDNALLDSARDVGANSWQIFWRIILPLMQRPILIVLTLNFIGLFGSYTLPYLLGPAAPQMMGVYMQTTFADYEDPNGAEVQAVISFLTCALVGFLYVRSVTSKPFGKE
jgi:ABC-type spermidine/putrescine transport system permease subunit I